ncbi:hypothetical protein JCM10296v2_000764 [Rhodotorula toruloides]
MPEQPLEGAAPSLLVLGPVSALLFGFTSGLVSSSKLASKQFLAENAHRLPTTVQGWYFYQKTKNYRVLFAGLKGGLKTGARLGLWTGAFLGLEQAVDAGLRQGLVLAGRRADEVRTTWVAGGVAGLGMAGAASWFYRLSRASSGRRYFYGLALGVVAGGTVDVRDWMKERLAKEA